MSRFLVSLAFKHLVKAMNTGQLYSLFLVLSFMPKLCAYYHSHRAPNPNSKNRLFRPFICPHFLHLCPIPVMWMGAWDSHDLSGKCAKDAQKASSLTLVPDL